MAKAAMSPIAICCLNANSWLSMIAIYLINDVPATVIYGLNGVALTRAMPFIC